MAEKTVPEAPEAQKKTQEKTQAKMIGELPLFRSRIFLLRHAEVSYTTSSGEPILETDFVPLTQEGRRQAVMVGDALRSVKFDRVFSSPLLRTMETARLALDDSRQRIEPLADLREISEGDYDMIPESFRRRELSYAYERAADAGARYAGGDSYIDFAERVRSAFFFLLEGNWRNLLVVSHDAVNRVILGSVLFGGDDVVGVLKLMSKLEQDYGCINIIEVDRRGGNILLRVKAMNVTGYDLGKEVCVLTSMERAFEGWLGVGE